MALISMSEWIDRFGGDLEMDRLLIICEPNAIVSESWDVDAAATQHPLVSEVHRALGVPPEPCLQTPPSGA